MESMKEILKQLNRRPISYYTIYAELMGSVAGGVYLSQIMYWWGVVKGDEFYKTDKELLQETKLSIREFRQAKKKLKSFPFIEIKAKGQPAKTHYSINYELLIIVLSSLNDGVKTGINDGVQTKLNDGVQTIYNSTEITTETTTEKKIAPNGAPSVSVTKNGKTKQDPNEPMDIDAFILWCRASSQIHMQIIAEWADQLRQSKPGWVGFKTRGAWDNFFIQPNLRAANKLKILWVSESGKDKISAAMDLIEKAHDNGNGYLEDFTKLATLCNYIPKVAGV